MADTPSAFHNGHFLVSLNELDGMKPGEIDAVTRHLTAASGGRVQFDWHYAAGYPRLLYIGAYDDARDTYLAEYAFLQDVSARHYEARERQYAKEMNRAPRPRTARKIGTLDGPPIAPPRAIDAGQSLNGAGTVQ